MIYVGGSISYYNVSVPLRSRELYPREFLELCSADAICTLNLDKPRQRVLRDFLHERLGVWLGDYASTYLGNVIIGEDDMVLSIHMVKYRLSYYLYEPVGGNNDLHS